MRDEWCGAYRSNYYILHHPLPYRVSLYSRKLLSDRNFFLLEPTNTNRQSSPFHLFHWSRVYHVTHCITLGFASRNIDMQSRINKTMKTYCFPWTQSISVNCLSTERKPPSRIESSLPLLGQIY